MCWCMIETSSDLPRKSFATSVIFGIFRKMSSETCAWLRRKLVGNPPKIVKKVNIFMVAYRYGISLLVFNLDIELNTSSSISTCSYAYTYNSRSYISNTSDSVSSGYPNTEKRVENTTRSGVFLTKFEVFG